MSKIFTYVLYFLVAWYLVRIGVALYRLFMEWQIRCWVRVAYRLFQVFVLPRLPPIAREMIFYDVGYKPHLHDAECSTCKWEYEEELERLKRLNDWYNKKGKL